MFRTFKCSVIFCFAFILESAHGQSCTENLYNDKQQGKTSTCMVWGGYNVRTFDDHGFSFRTDCGMILLSFEHAETEFRIDVEKSDKNCLGDECYTVTKIQYNCDTYRLSRDVSGLPNFGTVKDLYSLPIDLPHISVTQIGNRVIVNFTGIGVVIKWNVKNMVEISVENDKGYQLFGLCGNNDKCSSNDQMSDINGTLPNLNQFLDEWRVSKMCPGIIDTQSPCKDNTYNIQRAETACQILKDARFKDANEMLNPQLYIDACIGTHCTCTARNKDCLCETLDVYATVSINAGVTEVIWRYGGTCDKQQTCNVRATPKSGEVWSITTEAVTDYLEINTSALIPQCSSYVCPAGYEIKGGFCVDIDECIQFNPCGPLLECHNKEPGYECSSCPDGYRGNYTKYFSEFQPERILQDVCLDINECQENIFDCPDNALCSNTDGSYKCLCGPHAVLSNTSDTCVCEPGWSGDGQICLDINECTLNNGNCPTGTRCINSEGSYKCVNCDPNARPSEVNKKCVCNVGFAGDGTVCGVDTDMDSWPDNDLGCSGEKCRKDNCQKVPNSGQEDFDKNGVGDACEDDADNDGIQNFSDNCPTRPNANQLDSDGDGYGDACDNCPFNKNFIQRDIDGDQIGDVCDPDIDGDGVENPVDICPSKAGEELSDKDGDGVGDVCDNCPKIYNPKQEDSDEDSIGDVCDIGGDVDSDGINDDIDNCRVIPNSHQSDLDNDGVGDSCDEDMDNDGVPNLNDNCVMIYNPDQKDSSNTGKGDACVTDTDGDGIMDEHDNCPRNKLIYKTDFSNFEVPLIHYNHQISRIYSKGAEISTVYADYTQIAVGFDRFDNVDYEGTLYTHTYGRGYNIGFVFSYQSSGKFYAVTWNRYYGYGRKGVQIKLFNSTKGPNANRHNALYYSEPVADESRILWQSPAEYPYEFNTAYRWKLIHRPKIGLINLKIWSGTNVVVNSGDIFDKTLTGGRLGVLALYQQIDTWSNLHYECPD